MLDEELDTALKALVDEWNIAERRIKKAEQIRKGEVVSSAIFELRYAGRKLIDAIHLVLTEDWESDPETKRKIRTFIEDAAEDCVKAKHDAIDSMLDFITRWFHEAEEDLGFEDIHKFFPNYIEITSKISDYQDSVAQSRGDRTKLRDTTYNSIEFDHYDEILSLYKTMVLSQKRISAIISKRQRHERLRWCFSIIGIVVGIAGVGVAIFR